MAQPGPQAELAEASGYRNDCGFHCITHTLLKLPHDVLDELAQNNPAYQLIVNKFYDRYQLPGERSLRNMASVLKAYTHPFDHEILLGRVLRETLRENYAQFGVTQEELGQLRDWEQVSDEVLAKFANRLGADLHVVPDGQPDFTLNFPHNANGPASNFSIRLFHAEAEEVEVDGQIVRYGHYDFTFPDRNLNAYHNRAINLQYGNDGEFLPNGAALFDVAIAQDTVGPQREINIRNAFQRQVEYAREQAQRAPAPLPRDNPVPAAQQHVPLFNMRQGSEPALQQTQAGPSLTAKKAKKAKKANSEPAFHPPADPKVVRADFVNKLRERFGAGWEVTPERGEINVTDLANRARNVNITEHADTMKFTAAPGMVAEIATAASAYQEVLDSHHQDIEYDVDVRTPEQCREFLRELSDSGLAMGAIATIKINGQVVTDEERNELLAPYRSSSPGLRP